MGHHLVEGFCRAQWCLLIPTPIPPRQHFTWLASLGPVRPLTLNETLQAGLIEIGLFLWDTIYIYIHVCMCKICVVKKIYMYIYIYIHMYVYNGKSLDFWVYHGTEVMFIGFISHIRHKQNIMGEFCGQNMLDFISPKCGARHLYLGRCL